MKQIIDELIEMNPEFDYYLYSDEACAKFIEENFDKEVVAAFHTLKPGAYKSDLWRYCILYKLGGVYLDIKFVCMKPLLQVVKEHPTMFVNDIQDNCKNSLLRRGLYNAFMISPPNNEVFKYCIAEIVKNSKLRLYKSNTLHVTGPCLLREIVEKHLPNYKPPYVNFDNKQTGQAIIKNEKETICIGYKEYRDEQKLSQKSDHYSVLWKMKDIYN
jgi:mannosyltransferase OCH1-like enzyme